MGKVTPPPAESQLSRQDIELLASLKGGQDALLAQVNTIQLTMQQQDEARKTESEARRSEHETQMKEITTQVTELQTWRAVNVTPAHLAAWSAAAEQQKDLRRVWIITTGFVGLVATLVGIFMNQIWGWVSSLGK